jgi:hypothetical protein
LYLIFIKLLTYKNGGVFFLNGGVFAENGGVLFFLLKKWPLKKLNPPLKTI